MTSSIDLPSTHTYTPTTPQLHHHTQDKEAGRRGLAECRKEMGAYDACMQKFLAKNPGKQALFRVRVCVSVR